MRLSATGRLRDAEGARIARWFGEGAYGPVWFDDAGHAFPISEAERTRWRAQALHRLELYVEAYDRTMMEIVVAGIVLTLAAYAVIGALGTLIPMLGRVEPAFAALPAMGWPFVVEARYRLSLHRLRREIADRLIVRAPVQRAIAEPARRYNIFRVATGIGGMAVLSYGGVAAYRGIPADDYFPIMFAMVVPVYALAWAADRVDDRHRAR